MSVLHAFLSFCCTVPPQIASVSHDIALLCPSALSLSFTSRPDRQQYHFTLSCLTLFYLFSFFLVSILGGRADIVLVPSHNLRNKIEIVAATTLSRVTTPFSHSYFPLLLEENKQKQSKESKAGKKKKKKKINPAIRAATIIGPKQ